MMDRFRGCWDVIIGKMDVDVLYGKMWRDVPVRSRIHVFT